MPVYLTQADFLETFELVPRVAVNVILVNSKNEIALVRRNIQPEFGTWHMAGAFLLKNESLSDCILRIASKELGLKALDTSNGHFYVFEDMKDDPRGHVIDLAYVLSIPDGIEISSTPENNEVNFFDKLPDNMGFNHAETVGKLFQMVR
jgi:ADP-ribose pyrophosphatase YjhB (NUDIX family)